MQPEVLGKPAIGRFRPLGGNQGMSQRSWKSRLLELAAWACVSLATAVIMIVLSGRLLPANF
jgi:hypothetical protein